eukprot:CAMPEP_0119335606 /NCGR_PEP_ID=MMETSP1333-20130426/89941_1 /TAXON_ID=418940 /ORGANISM="Scyphosphaera apsteinii, Strain RCC1455" /LENGTH=70 /DNA_ID=CAMNT_0007346199 /DNA_START=192 /DNA_END=404 /DNA_ORIENTATION=-
MADENAPENKWSDRLVMAFWAAARWGAVAAVVKCIGHRLKNLSSTTNNAVRGFREEHVSDGVGRKNVKAE